MRTTILSFWHICSKCARASLPSCQETAACEGSCWTLTSIIHAPQFAYLSTKHWPKAIWPKTAHEHACPLSSAIIITSKASKLTSEPSARESQQQLFVDTCNRWKSICWSCSLHTTFLKEDKRTTSIRPLHTCAQKSLNCVSCVWAQRNLHITCCSLCIYPEQNTWTTLQNGIFTYAPILALINLAWMWRQILS